MFTNSGDMIQLHSSTNYSRQRKRIAELIYSNSFHRLPDSNYCFPRKTSCFSEYEQRMLEGVISDFRYRRIYCGSFNATESKTRFLKEFSPLYFLEKLLKIILKGHSGDVQRCLGKVRIIWRFPRTSEWGHCLQMFEEQRFFICIEMVTIKYVFNITVIFNE